MASRDYHTAAERPVTDALRVGHGSVAAYRELLVGLIEREVRARYSQSALGLAWAVLQPLAMMAVFTLVFSRVAGIPSEGVPYPLFSYAALVPWLFFANAVTSGTGSIVTYRTIVTKTYFHREVIPLAQVGARLVDFAAAALVYVALMAYYGVPPTRWALLVPLVLAVHLLFTAAVTLATSALNVFYRDVGPAMQLGLQVWLYLTPVAYPLTAVPERYRGWVALNPLTGVIEAYRALVVFGRAPDWAALGASALVTVLLFLAALALFKRLEPSFADVI